MLIRSRILLISGIVVALTILVLLVSGAVRDNLQQKEFSARQAKSHSILWTKIVEQIILRMADKAWIVAENADLAKAMQANDVSAMTALGDKLVAELKTRKLADRLDIFGRNGRLVYSSQKSVFPSPLVDPLQHRDAFRTGKRLQGVGNDRERNVGVALFLPVKVSGQVVGAATVSSNIQEALDGMSDAVESEVLLINRRNRLLEGTDANLWDALDPSGETKVQDLGHRVETGSSTFGLTVVPFKAGLSNLVGHLLVVSDITVETSRQGVLQYAGFAGLAGLLLLCLGGIYVYVRQTLAPLEQDVAVLDALAVGDTDVEAVGSEKRDEVGQMAKAINALRTELLAFGRMRRSREKQRRRQEQFIRNEMRQLIDTLDGDAKRDLARDLAKIDKRLANRPSNTAQGGADDIAAADSLGLMAETFNSLSTRIQSQHKNMQGLIGELQEALEAKTAYLSLQRELEIGQRVQLSSLPPDYQENPLFDLSGHMVPAKEVGGDFYDFFDLDENRVAIVIADVSGKGVPAALFMATSKTTIRAAARTIADPGECLAAVNNLLLENNREELFVTVFLGIYDRTTAELVYANGGHNDPVRIGGKTADFLKSTDGVALAVFEDMVFETETISLTPGEKLLFYTDGVTEAFDPKDNDYGNKRLLSFSKRVVGDGAQTVEKLIASVNKFAKGAEQADDITVVCLNVKSFADKQA